MYITLLVLHSILRSLVLIGLVYAVFRAYSGWLGEKEFTKLDNSVRHWATTLCHIQLMVGIFLYFISPLSSALMHHFKDTVHVKEIRFYGMEHSLLMFVAIIIITIGSMKAKRKPTDKEKFKTQAIWFTIGLATILIVIGMMMSPLLASRPWVRW